jgi:type I restriction enzyme S subunit
MTHRQEQNVPKLRFPGFEGALKSVKLGDFATFSKGKGISKSDIDPDGDQPCIRYGELYTTYDTVIDQPISKTSIPVSKLKLSKGDEVLVPASGEDAKDIATAVVVKQAGVALGGDLNIIHSKNDGAFLASYLSGRKRMTLAAMAQGNSVVHLYPAQLKTLDLYLPAIPEQRKIAGFLGAVDDKIAHLSRKKALLEDYKKGCMQQLFSQKIRFKDEGGKSFPEWKEKRLGEVLSYEQPTKYLVASSEYSNEYNTPVLTAGKTFILGYTDEKEGIFTNLPVIIFDDFTTAFKFVNFHFKAKSSAMKMLNLRCAEDDIRFFHAAMIQVEFQVGEHKRYWISEYQNEVIPYPHPAEQRKIADFLSALDRKIDLVDQELTLARSFKAGLLQ